MSSFIKELKCKVIGHIFSDGVGVWCPIWWLLVGRYALKWGFL